MASLSDGQLLTMVRTTKNIDPANFPMFFEPRKWNGRWWTWCTACESWTDHAHQVSPEHRDRCCRVVETTSVVQLIHEGVVRGPSTSALRRFMATPSTSPTDSAVASLPLDGGLEDPGVASAPVPMGCARRLRSLPLDGQVLAPSSAAAVIAQALCSPPASVPSAPLLPADVPAQQLTPTAEDSAHRPTVKAPPAMPAIYETYGKSQPGKAPPPRPTFYDTHWEPSPVRALPLKTTSTGNHSLEDFTYLRYRIQDFEGKFSFMKGVLDAMMEELANLRASLPEDNARRVC